jgi:phosphoribosyl 1,2-cyclic phosphodiesterase
MRLRFWGVRGSVPVPNPNMLRYGGNTSCVEVTLDDGTEIILDAGTGIRELGAAREAGGGTLQLLLTHLHVDHIYGLLFFPPLFDPGNEITVYGPPAPGPDLDQRLARYLSAPLSPVDLHELPARVDFAACPYDVWRVGSARVEAAIVAHRGVTMGFRITEGDKTVCYLPDHEPALGAAIGEAPDGWISGLALAERATVLIHDGQYDDDEYPDHVGWGHSALSDAIAFAYRAEVERLVLFHHDPAHDDARLDELGEQARSAWRDRGGDAGAVSLAREGATLSI